MPASLEFLELYGLIVRTEALKQKKKAKLLCTQEECREGWKWIS